MRTIKKSTPANDPVNLSPIKTVSAEQMQVVIKFLPVLENINPEDLGRVTKPFYLSSGCRVIFVSQNWTARFFSGSGVFKYACSSTAA
jgi:hypothetical protein